MMTEKSTKMNDEDFYTKYRSNLRKYFSLILKLKTSQLLGIVL